MLFCGSHTSLIVAMSGGLMGTNARSEEYWATDGWEIWSSRAARVMLLYLQAA